MSDGIRFRAKVQELISDNESREAMFDTLRRYQATQDLNRLLSDLRQLLDEPHKLEMYEYIRPLILLSHQMEYSFRAPSTPGIRLRTVRLRRVSGQSLGFAVRGGYEFGVGVFVSVVETGSQAEKQGLRVGDEIIRVNGFTISEAIHEDVLNLIKSREEIILKVTHIGMLPIKNHVSDNVTWQYVEDLNSKATLSEVLQNWSGRKGKPLELKIFIDSSGVNSIGCGILSGPAHYPGIFIEKVRPGSLAEEVGLEVGDQIVEVNETSFQNIGHNEAVVVLKSSKQLNVVIRKRTGLPLFEKGSSSQPASIPSPGRSQRSFDYRLDESDFIAEHVKRVASRMDKKGSQNSTERAVNNNWVMTSSNGIEHHAQPQRLSTQADVHISSDYSPGNKRKPEIPLSEFTTWEIDGRELSSILYPKDQTLDIEMEGGVGTPLGSKIVVAAVFDGGVAQRHGLHVGDQLMMINGRKIINVKLSEAERILQEVSNGQEPMIHIVYAPSSFLNDDEYVTYF